MKYKILFVSLLSVPMWGQQKIWSLADCIRYAVDNNITVKKTQLGQQTAAINLDQAKNNRLPSVSANISANANHGSIRQLSPIVWASMPLCHCMRGTNSICK